jgi:hypothetical protein
MELLNLAMLLVTMLAAVRYLRSPDSGARLSLLVLSTVLLAQARYESSLFVAPAALVVLEGWRRAGRIMLPPAALLAPVLLIPCALHNTYLAGTPVLWELRDDLDGRFALEHLTGNLRHAFAYFFDFTTTMLSSWWLSVAGFTAVGFAAWHGVRSVRNWRTLSGRALAGFMFAAAISANLGLLLFYFWGQLSDPIVARLVLPFTVVLGLSIAWALQRAELVGWSRASSGVFFGSLLASLAFSPPAIARMRDINQRAHEIRWEQEVVGRLPPHSRLMITNKSSLGWIVHGVAAIGIDRARAQQELIRLNLENGTFRDVLVTQLFRPSSEEGEFALDPKDELTPGFVIEKLAERRMGPAIARISRVVRIEPKPTSAPTVESAE